MPTKVASKTSPAEPKTYDEKVIRCFKDACKNNGSNSASPADVTRLMAERKWLTSLDTVIDIADIMKELRNRGDL
jgi:hypothetical protein